MKNRKKLSAESGNGSVVHKSVKAAPPRKKKTVVVKETNGAAAHDNRRVHHGDAEIDKQLSGNYDSRELLRVLTAVKNGDFSVRMPFDQVGISGKISDTLNEIIT